ncbi:glycosyltransferase [Alicyclobacillus sp. SO9]|uniref:glycosyltransferase n=1 Tax=Alicyclobacillus sp. SO9 TaxID=2665646 RepID=UPI001E5DA6DB|nr:glycosyltransferase [Alicyclobacillus sp. SO9]
MTETDFQSEYSHSWRWDSVRVAKLFVSLRPYRLSDATGWVDPVSKSAAALLSLNACRTLSILPFAKHNQRVFVACSNPEKVQDEPTLRELAMETHCSIVLCGTDLDDLVFAWRRLEEQPGTNAENRLGEILLQEGKLSGQELIDALEAQKETGSRVGAILTSGNSLTSWDVALAIAQQRKIPVVDLLHQPQLKTMLNAASLAQVWESVSDEFWHRHLVVPLGRDATTLTVAMVDPDDSEALTALTQQFQCKVRICAAGYRDVMSALAVKYSKEHEESSRLALVARRPDESASVRFSRGQIVTATVLLVLFAGGVAIRPLWTIAFVVIVLQLIYAANNVFRLWLMQRSAKQTTEYTVTKVDLAKIPPVSLPAYTVLVPVYKEAEVLPDLVEAIKNLQYPKDRLDVKLLLEEDDEETIQIAKASKLPNFIEMVIVPSSEPKTKPKACNYGLMRARGEYVVIFDAEDIPEPDQLLKAISVFRQNKDQTLACVQAKLSYYNAEQNILTRWFTAEYANWFELSLPALFSHDLPIPLGGTSNHFRADVLKEMGAWDPYNVAEDADLGIRMHKHGYRTAIVNSTTFEEANADFLNWIRQRSRWVKGYMQTWLVHMRRPVELHRALGVKGTAAFHMIVGGTPFTFLLNPLMWFMTVLWFIFKPHFMHQLYDNPIYYLSVINFMFGNFAFTYVNVVGTMQRQSWPLAKYALLSPIYWIFMSIASWKALYQLFVKPSYWEKTIHGLAKKDDKSITQILTVGSNS